MPHLKKRPEPFADLLKLLKANDLGSSRKLAAVLYCSDYTGRARLKSPGDLTLTELQAICRNGHIPADEIREAIKFS